MTSALQPRASFRRVLMTGGTGFVGRYLAPLLCKAFPNARRVMLTRPGAGESALGWETTEADVCDDGAMMSVIGSFMPDLVIHMAAQASVGQSHSACEATWRINFGGSFALARAIAANNPTTTMLFTSSAEVYGASFSHGPVAEDSVLLPQNCYARSKAAAEMMLGDILSTQGRLIVTRAFNHIGAGQDERFVMASLAAQIARIERREQPPVVKVGNLEAARDFLDVRDVCRAYVEILSIAPKLPSRAVFNISSGEATRVGDALAKMQALSTSQFIVEVDPGRLRQNDVKAAIGINRQLVLATSWHPRFSLDESLKSLLEGTRSGRSFTG